MHVLTVRVGVRAPFAGAALLDFLAYHVVPGVEASGPGWYARTVSLAHGPGTVRLELDDRPEVLVTLGLTDRRDEAEALHAVRTVVGADDDTGPVHARLDDDPVIGPLSRSRPGLRVPGQVDADETAVRTVVGQQISVVGARTVTARMVAEHGTAVETGVPGLTHLFPDAATLAAVDPETLPMPRARGRALVGLCAALAEGRVVLDLDQHRPDVRRAMIALPGIGPWTADYVAMRALRDPDAFLPTDLGVRQAITRLGLDPVPVVADAARWSPWRSYALMHLWATLMPAPVVEGPVVEGPGRVGA